MYKTYRSDEIRIGSLLLGGDQPVRIQSMANTDTNDTEASAEQCRKMISAGAELVRLTTQGIREAENLGRIRALLKKESLSVPVIADVHFNPAVAEKAAALVDKVRINPGNYTEKRSDGTRTFSEEAFLKGRDAIRERIAPLLLLCEQHQTAIRIGVNHGSLSPRIMLKYGDTPLGMAESAMEFIRICHESGFNRLVVSMKSSNTRVMVQSVRLLVSKLLAEGLRVPLHLGVTEAGNGDDGRIRSATGIAPLLAEGLGDTIRVSLTEAPEKELPVARALRTHFPKPQNLPYDPLEKGAWDPFSYSPPERIAYKGIGGGKIPVVITGGNPETSSADLCAVHRNGKLLLTGTIPGSELIDDTVLRLSDLKNIPGRHVVETGVTASPLLTAEPEKTPLLLILKYNGEPVSSLRYWLKQYYEAGQRCPVIFRYSDNTPDRESWLVKMAGVCGSLLIDGLIDGIWADQPEMDQNELADIALNILQASRSRFTRTEYIACPSCGRTLFDIESTLEKIRKSTAHLPGLKIAVMGCIVNGPGEMADADYGYVGAGRGLVTLYRGKTAVKKGVPEDRAVDELINLIREHGDWADPSPSPVKK